MWRVPTILRVVAIGWALGLMIRASHLWWAWQYAFVVAATSITH